MATKSEHTRALILQTALAQFRARGFDESSMREIAREAGMSLGAAYYYFPSKESLVAAWYESVQSAHEAAADRALVGVSGAGPRLEALLMAKLDLVADERRLLGALFRFAGDPEHPLGVFAKETAEIRARSIATHARAFEGLKLEPALRRRLAEAAWLAHLGLLISAVHDRTPGLARTRALAELVAGLAEQIVSLAASPMAGPLVGELIRRLAEIEAMGVEDAR